MKMRRWKLLPLSIVIATILGCAHAPNDKNASVKGEDIKIYNPAQLRQGEYRVVARLWADSTLAQFWVPTYSTEEKGIAALKDKAAAFGANALTNVACYKDRGEFVSLGDSFQIYICYGLAIRVPEASG